MTAATAEGLVTTPSRHSVDETLERLDGMLRGSMPPEIGHRVPPRTGLRTGRLRHLAPTSFAALLAVAVVFTARSHGEGVGTKGFRAAIGDAVGRMHAAMTVPFTGDADRDFARMMIPHHQGAIDMALVELRFGKDERLRRLAQEIIVEQQQEITVMHLALGDPLPPGTPAPTQVRRSAGDGGTH
jgi:hypothetical protein